MNDLARTVLVTGANGGLGGSLFRALASEPGLDAIPWTRTVNGDITDFGVVDAVVSHTRPHAVVHLAGITGVACERDPQKAFRTNVEATLRLARAAADAGTRRLIFASSAAVYGDSGNHPFRESDNLAGTSVYAQTKIQAEAALAEVATQTGLEVIALRIFNVYGDDFPTSLITRIRNASADSPVVLKGTDEFVRDYIHGDDVALTLLKALTTPLERAWSVVNVASGRPTSNAHLCAMLPTAKRPHVKIEPGKPSYSVADMSLNARTLSIDARGLASYI